MELIHAAGITQALLLAMYFFHRRKEPGNLAEASLLLVVAFTIAMGYLYGSGLILNWPHLSRLGFTLLSLIGPFFWMSLKQRQGRKINWKDLVWFAVPIGITIYLIPFHLSSTGHKLEYLRQDLVQIHFDCIVILYFSLVNNLVSMTGGIWQLYREDKSSLEENPGTAASIGTRLYYSLPVILLITTAVLSSLDPNLLNSGLFSAVGSLIVLGRSYVVLYNRESSGAGHAMFPPAQRYRKSLLSDDLVEAKGREIEIFLEDESPYLEPDFQLSDLAKRLDLSSVQTSQILNRYFHCGFVPLIQKKRVEHARRLLQSRDSSFTILDIAMESGFNSKSAFNAAFRRIVGQSPSEFRKQPGNLAS